MDPELLPGSGSGIIVPDTDPAKYERADKQKCYFSLNSALCVPGTGTGTVGQQYEMENGK